LRPARAPTRKPGPRAVDFAVDFAVDLAVDFAVDFADDLGVGLAFDLTADLVAALDVLDVSDVLEETIKTDLPVPTLPAPAGFVGVACCWAAVAWTDGARPAAKASMTQLDQNHLSTAEFRTKSLTFQNVV